MKSVFSVMFLFLCGSANADSLDKTVAKLNKEMNPVLCNQEGFEIDYRQETTSDHIITWINISKVKKECGYGIVYYLKNSEVAGWAEFYSQNKGVWEGKESPLFQVTCIGLSGKECRNALAREVTTKVIKEMVGSKIHDAKVR